MTGATGTPSGKPSPPMGLVLKEFGRECGVQVLAGGSAGFVEICIMHPLDVVKTRFQVQSNAADPERYKSMVDCFRKMIKSEGYLSIYKGILPPILAETPKRAVKFLTFEQYKKVFRFKAAKDTPVSLSLAGLCAGLTEALFVNPFEAVKVRLQTDKSKASERLTTFQVARSIYRERGFGLRGLNLGLTSTMARNGAFNMIYFGFYHSNKHRLPKTDSKASDRALRSVVGFCAGSLASCVNIPFDVAKSRIQSSGHLPNPKYHSCLQTVSLVYREEGFRALYKGLAPKVVRLGPGGAVMLVVYEEFKEVLDAAYPPLY